jgi:Bifunctional DNA primase/polymerase, N-terminal
MSTTMTLEWLELRNAAISATRWGWPVVPGTFLGPERHWHGRDNAAALGPIVDGWQSAPVTNPDEADQIWSQHPYGVLLVCGRGVDVLELPRRIKPLSVFRTGGLVLPIAVSGPPMRWQVVVATGSGALLPELARASVRLRGAGAWVALPPTPVAELFTARWIALGTASTPLVDADAVQQVLRTALVSSGPVTSPDDDD